MPRSATDDMIADGEVCGNCHGFIGGTPAGRPQLCERCERERARTATPLLDRPSSRRGRLGNGGR